MMIDRKRRDREELAGLVCSVAFLGLSVMAWIAVWYHVGNMMLAWVRRTAE